MKGQGKKDELQQKCQQYKNVIPLSHKKTYFTKFFQDNLNEIENTNNGIKNKIISLKNLNYSLTKSFTVTLHF